jgi:hypothetical protein
MAKCNSCNGVITRSDLECYVCGEPVPGAPKKSMFSSFLRFWAKPTTAGMKRVMMADATEAVDADPFSR